MNRDEVMERVYELVQQLDRSYTVEWTKEDSLPGMHSGRIMAPRLGEILETTLDKQTLTIWGGRQGESREPVELRFDDADFDAVVKREVNMNAELVKKESHADYRARKLRERATNV